MADSYFFIATDLYLGPKSKYYDGMPEYLKYFRQKEFISTEIMERIAFNLAQKDPNDNTLLNDMIWWGKVMYFEQAMQPLEPDSVIARYSGKHLLFAIENEMAMWTYFVDNKLLFDSNAELKRKFIEPAPYSKFGMPFDNETPGVIGRWMGWRIVSSYMRNNPEIKLPDLMSDTDYKSIFKNSKYKP
jgi:hypothetical protein